MIILRSIVKQIKLKCARTFSGCLLSAALGTKCCLLPWLRMSTVVLWVEKWTNYIRPEW